MTKFYSKKSNAERAARSLDVARVVAIDGQWAVVTPEGSAAEEDAPVKQIARDRDPRAVDLNDPNPEEVAENEVVAQEAKTALDAHATPAVLSMMLQISVDAVDAKRLATMVARYLGRTVEIVSPAAGTVEVVSRGPKSNGAARRDAARPRVTRGSKRPDADKIVALVERPEGVTRKGLFEATSAAPNTVWRSVLTTLARQSGRELEVRDVEGRATYFFKAA